MTEECRELFPCGSWNCAPTFFQPQGRSPVIGQVRPQVRGRPYLQLHEFLCFTLITRVTRNPKSLVIKTFTLFLTCKRAQHCWMLHVASVCTPCCMLLSVVGSCLAKFATVETFSYLQTGASTSNKVVSICTELKYASYTWVIPHKPTARAIQKDVLYKKEEKYGAHRKRTTAIMNVFNDTQLRLIFTSLIHFTKNRD